GYVDAALGPVSVDLTIARKANKSIPTMVTLGLDFAYTDADGIVLYSKKMQSIGRGDVEITKASCEVKGLETIAKEAIGYVTDGMAAYLGTSTKITEAAQAVKGGPKTTASENPAVAPQSAIALPVPVPRGESASVIFRAIVHNQNRNQVLHTGETVAIEIEVK